MLEPLVHGRTRGLVLPHPEDPRFNGREKVPEVSEYEQKKKNHVPTEMRNGMRGLLDLHNDDEIRILCGCLGMHSKRSKQGRIAKIFALHLNRGENSYKNVLDLVWEGIIIEYN